MPRAFFQPATVQRFLFEFVSLPFLKIRMAPAIITPATKIAQRRKALPPFSWEICGVGLEGGAGLGDGVVVGVGLRAGGLVGVDIVAAVGTAVAVGVDEALSVAVALGVCVGCVGVVVDAKQDAIEFYSALGFQPIDLTRGSLGDRPEPIAMFLPIRQIAAAAKRDGD